MKKSILYIILMVISATVFCQNVYVVTKTTDPNPFDHKFNNDDNLCDPEMYGTLQWAINKVNYNGGESRIEFNIPGSGIHEITSNSYLPQINRPVVIDGTTQPGYTTGNPVIKITGQMKTQYGFNAYNTTVTIKGLEISNFARSAIMLTECIHSKIIDNKIYNISFSGGYGIHVLASNYTEIFGNRIEIDALPEYGRSSVGIYVYKTEYCVIGGTESGKANTIANCEKVGVVINGDKYNKVSGNAIYNNPRAIQLGSTANDNIQPPTITDYTNGVLKGTSLPNSIIEVFGSTGSENANEYLVSTIASENGDWSVEVSTEFEYFIGTQRDGDNNSSRLSTTFQLMSDCSFDCLPEHIEGCNLICNPNMICPPGYECGYQVTPPGWCSSHGSANGMYPTLNIPVFIPGQTGGYISFGSCGGGDPWNPDLSTEPNCPNVRGEGIMTKFLSPMVEGKTYQISYYRAHSGLYTVNGVTAGGSQVEQFHVKLINTSVVNLPDGLDNWELPIIEEIDGECKEVYFEQPIINETDWQYVEFTYTAQFPYDGIWLYNEVYTPHHYGTTLLNGVKIIPINESTNEIVFGPACANYGEPLQLSVTNQDAISFEWSGPNNFTSNVSNPTVTDFAQDIHSGTYYVTVTMDHDCIYTSSVEVHIQDVNVTIGSYIVGTEPPQYDYSVNEAYICPYTYQTIRAKPSGATNYQFEWSDATNTEYFGTSDVINASPDIAPYTYVVTVTSLEGCIATDEFTIYHYDLPETPEPYNTGPYCIGDDIELNVTNPNPDYQYRWHAQNSPGWSSPFELGGYHAIRQNAMNNSCCEYNYQNFNDYGGNYLVSVMNENGCITSASTDVFVHSDISCLTAETNSPICHGENLTIILHADGFQSNQFCEIMESNIVLEGEYGIIPYELDATALIINSAEVTLPENIHITIDLLDNCQTKELDVDVTVYELPYVELPTEQAFCNGSTVEIIPVHSDNILEYTWQGPDFYFSHDPIASFTLENSWGQDDLTLTVTDNHGCMASSTMTLVLRDEETFDVNIEYEIPTCFGDLEYSLFCNTNADIENCTFDWSGPNGFTSNEQNPVIPNPDIENVGHYYVAVHDGHCIVTDETVINFLDCDSDIDLTCTQIPVTCRTPFNGAIEVSIFDGNPPYNVQISRNGTILNSTNLDFDGDHIIDLEGIEPNEMPIIIEISDAQSNIYYSSIIEGLSYAWDLILTNNNLHDQNSYENLVIATGDYYYEGENLDFYEDISFTGCKIYTGTHNMNSWVHSELNINIPSTVTFEDCIIESGCPNRLWQGITVNGIWVNTDPSQNAHLVFNNSTISDANQAISSYHNGTVVATNSTFSNNVYGIWLYNSNHGIHQISNNDFITERKLNHPYLYPKSHVYLFKVRNLLFKENEFKNIMPYDNPDYAIQERGTGIESITSSFIATPFEQGELYNNRFEGLYYGINAKHQCTYPPQINYCDFVDNYRGVHMMSLYGPRLLFNEFYTTQEIPEATQLPGIPVNEEPETNASYAAYINSCADYKVEENNAKDMTVGFFIYNSGDAAGSTFYRNTIGDNSGSNLYNMFAGSLIVGKNSNFIQGDPFSSGLNGLEIKCNNYSSTFCAIGVINGNMRSNQGSNSSSTDQLAGNQFHDPPLANGMDFAVQINLEYEDLDLGTYNYWQHDDDLSLDNDFYRELSANIVGVHPQTVFGMEYDDNSCLSNIQFPIPVNEFEDIMDDIAIIGTLITSKKALYEDLVDRGNTAYMREVAANLNPSNFRQFVPVLFNDGYLSNEVFETILDNRTAQKPVIAAVLISNSPLPTNIMVKVENSTYLSNGHKKQVRKYQQGINSRVLLEYNIADLEQDKAIKESHLINNAINNDSVPELIDLVISYLNTQNNDYKKLIKIYDLNMAKQDYSASITSLDNIRQFASIPENEIISDELLQYCDIQDLFISSMQNNNSLVAHKDILLEAALDGSALYSATAQVLYEIAADTVFAEYTPLPFDVAQPRKAEISETITQEEYLPLINVYPNPTDGEINVEYDFAALYNDGNDILLEELGINKDENCEKGDLSLYSEDGKLLQQFRLNTVKDSFRISIKDYTPGNYLLVIMDCFGNTQTVIITKFK